MRRLFAVLLCLLMAGLCACGEIVSPEDTTITENKTVLEGATKTNEIKLDETAPYSDIIEESIKERLASDYPERLGNQYYALYDIDSDGKKELLLGRKMLNDTYFLTIYTIHDGVAVHQEVTKHWLDYGPAPTLFENGTIRRAGNDDGNSYISYLRFENSELKPQVSLSDNYDFWGSYFRSFPDQNERTPITKAEYDRLKSDMEGDGQVVELDWKPLAEWGR